MERFRAVTALAAQHQIPVRGYISCVIACPYSGKVDPAQVARVAEQLAVDCTEVSLGDTIGMGTPGTVRPCSVLRRNILLSREIFILA